MSPVDPRPPQPVFSNNGLAFAVYVLNFAAYFTGITAVVGVIIAHIQHGGPDAMLNTHYRFQIRTFWIGLIYIVVGSVLSLVLVGFLILFWWFVWSLVRNIKGILALNENRPVPNPGSWLFG